MDVVWETLFWVAVGVASVAGILAAVALIGCFFPRRHVVARALKSARPPEQVWQTITDFAATPGWHSEIQKVERLSDHDGHEVWRETYKGGYPLQLETVEAAAPHRLVRTIADEKGPFTGRWEFDVAPADGGSRVTLTEHGEVANPFFRFMFRVFMNPATYLEMYLKALAKKLGDAPALEKPLATKS